jgi:hypothetical protein
MAGGHIGPTPSSRFAAALLRFAPSGDSAGPMRRSLSVVFGETSRPAGRLRCVPGMFSSLEVQVLYPT